MGMAIFGPSLRNPLTHFHETWN